MTFIMITGNNRAVIVSVPRLCGGYIGMHTEVSMCTSVED